MFLIVQNPLLPSEESWKKVHIVSPGTAMDLLDKAECVVVLPSVKKFALGVGARYGRGAMVCRRGEDFQGKWGPPSMTRLEGGNIGFQIGGESTDYILLVMNEKGASSILTEEPI